MKIQHRLYDANVLSGSSDALRNSVGGYYTVIQSSASVNDAYLDFKETITPFDTDIFGESIISTPRTSLIDKVLVQRNVTTLSSSNSMFPYYVIPVSIQGSLDVEEASDDSRQSINVEKWKSFILGGNYNNIQYPGIFSNTIHDVNNFSFDVPYGLLYAKTIDRENYASYTTLNSKSVYNKYLPAYQKGEDNNSLLVQLNAYELAYCTLVDQDATDPIVSASITLGGLYNHASSSIFDTAMKFYPALIKTSHETISSPSHGERRLYADAHFRSRKYFYDFALSNSGSSSPAYFLNKKAISQLFGLVDEHKDYYPFYNKISLPSFGASALNETIIEANFSNLLLKSLKNVFVDNSVAISANNFVSERSFRAADDNGNATERTTVENSSYNFVDFNILLAQLSNEPGAGDALATAPGRFIGESNIENRAPIAEASALRHLNKINTYNMLNTVQKSILSTIDSGTMLDEDYLPWSDISEFSINKFFSLAKHNLNEKSECVALRLEKIDTTTNSVVSNVMIQNQPPDASTTGTYNADSSQGDPWCYYDMEVKYGTPYTYNTYAYFMVVGYKYEYSDLVLSRPIGSHGQYDAGDFIVPGFDYAAGASTAAVKYTCIEFYDPNSGNSTPSPMQTSNTTLLSPVRVNLLDVASIEGYATAAQELVLDNSLNWADFNLKIEPIIRIFEVPVATKTLTVLDNPPPKAEVQPYQVKDQSQAIGFYIKLENPPVRDGLDTSIAYPTPITSDERITYSRYLSSQNMLDTDKVKFGTVSKPTKVQVYRLSHKPKSMSEFEGNLVTTKDLVIRDENNNLHRTYITPVCFYDERIATSHKFYYTFRYLNENNTPGAWSHIIEAELVEDGGYKYAVFNSIIESELEKDIKHEHPYQQFKKLLMLRPTIPQIDLDALNLNYDITAEEAYDDVTLGNTVSSKIWDKTYKIRLTSRKTGKKIDLNVTYKLREGYVDSTTIESYADSSTEV
jgi:hypothetical protein